MDALRIGPMALPLAVLLPLVATLAALAVAHWLRRRRGIDVERDLSLTMLAGWTGARLAFVALHGDLYAEQPLQIFNMRDGGFVPSAGLLAAAGAGLLLTARERLRRTLLGIAAGTGLAVWAAGALALLLWQPSPLPLPDVELSRLDGTPVRLHAFAGKPLVVNLWATWCPPCRREMPALVAAQARHPDVAIVLVNQKESAEQVRDFLRAQGMDGKAVLLDPAGRLATATRSSVYPTTLFYGSDGKLVYRRAGEVSAAMLGERIAAFR